MPSNPAFIKYHCGICGREIIEGGVSPKECILCLKPLCPSCNKKGLCPEHYNSLPPRQRWDLGLYSMVQPILESRSGLQGGSLVVIIIATIIITLILIAFSIHPTNDPIMVARRVTLAGVICLGVMGIILLIKAYRQTIKMIPQIKVGIYSLLAPYATLGAHNKLASYYNPEKPYQAHRINDITPLEMEKILVKIPRELQEDALRNNSATNQTYTCGICGASVTIGIGIWKMLYCHICYWPLCPQCNHAGLCNEDYARLTPQQQQDLQKSYQGQLPLLKRANRWYNIPPIPWIVFIPLCLFGVAYSNANEIVGMAIFTWSLIVGVILFAVVYAWYRRIRSAYEKTILAMDTLIQEFIPTFNLPTPTPTLTVPSQPQQSLPEDPFLLSVKSSKSVIYCPTCHIAHPSFAEYCMKCGKHLPISNEPAKNQ